MNKTQELVKLEKDEYGHYVATIYDLDKQKYENRVFLRHTKKEIYALLRADNISIPRGI